MDSQYNVAKDIVLVDNTIPLTWWNVTPNFGDLLSPYLINKITSKQVKLISLRPGFKVGFVSRNLRKKEFSYFAIGSIISRVNRNSIVWGSGAFGTEGSDSLNKSAKYLAVRGPLTRNLLRIHGVPNVPEIYGDPALLMPKFFNPKVEKKFKLGIIIRWSEKDWNAAEFDPEIKKIYLGTEDVEGTLIDILSCERILSSSLHGIILADAYGIPSAWLKSDTPKGLEFKFYDYFISVNKIQKPQSYNFSDSKISLNEIMNQINFDDRPINFDSKALLDACPFLERNC